MDLTTAVSRLFTPAAAPTPGRVGIEIEMIPSSSVRPVPPGVLGAGFDPAFVAGARPSFEPGGQLELSPPPCATVRELVDRTSTLIARAEAIAADRGVRLDLVGVDPHHDLRDVPLRTRSPRYLAMQRAFDAVGPDGRRMMRLTAALQVSVDLLPGAAGREQWLVANLAGPALSTAYANSPGAARSRTAIWYGVDLRRTGYDGRHVDPVDPVGAYAAFAAAAPRFPIAETSDPDYHLSTLFPPVRPRGGYLEVRYLDAQPTHRVAEAVCTLTALLYDARARREALDLLLPGWGDLGAAWRAAARGESTVVDAVLAIARGGLSRLPSGYLPEPALMERWAAA